jgi:hypothetical protein
MNNRRNAYTTHPRKQARRDRAADRFSVDAMRAGSKQYLKNKSVEAYALGVIGMFPELQNA